MSRSGSNKFVPDVQLLPKFTSGIKVRFDSDIGHHLETTKYEVRHKITKAE